MTSVAWIASYPKSGNTWLRFMLTSYLLNVPVRSVRNVNAVIPIVDGIAGHRSVLAADRQDPLLVKTHQVPGAKAMEPYQPCASKAVYLVRNPRDILLSHIRHAGAQPDGAEARDLATEFIAHQGMPLWREKFEIGSWPENVRDWTTPATVRRYFPGIDVLTVRYEDMRADPEGTLHQILCFLDFGPPVIPQDVHRAVQHNSLENMRALEDKERSESPGRPFSPFGSRGQFVGQGLHNQSLSGLGADVEAEFGRLAQDPDFAACAQQFGYAG